jgi:hypothetical protein
MTEDDNKWKITNASIVEPPKVAGAYWVGGNGGLCIQIKKRPSWMHRFMMRWAFGWVWKDL